jgi:hypothetical protein
MNYKQVKMAENSKKGVRPSTVDWNDFSAVNRQLNSHSRLNPGTRLYQYSRKTIECHDSK